MKLLFVVVGICLLASIAQVKADDITCDICKWAVGEAEKLVAQNKSETVILDTLATGCDTFIAKSVIDKCKAFVKTDGPKIIAAAEAKEDPQVACTQMDACPKIADADGCSKCHSFFGAILRSMDFNVKDTAVFAQDQCARFPRKLSEQCSSFVRDNLATFQHLIAKYPGISLDRVCQDLELCGANPPASVVQA